MAKAKKLPSGSWRYLTYDYTDPIGKRCYKSFTAETKKETEYMATEYAMYKKQRTRSDKTFGDDLEDYINCRDGIVSPRTTMSYRRIQRNDLDLLLSVKRDEITQDLIQEWANQDAKKHAPKTVRDTHGLIAAVMKRVRPDFALNTVLPKSIRSQLYIATDNDIKNLMAYVSGTDMELPVLLAAFGSMRRGEICALHSNSISGNVVYVHDNMVLTTDHTWITKGSKSFDGDRFIEFPEFVSQKWQGILGRITDLNPDNITSRFGRLLKRAGIPHFRFHDLRHYSASIQHAIGVPDAYIMQRAEWKNDGVLKNIYRHAMDDKTQEMNSIANNYFEKMQQEMQHNKNKS